MRLLTGALLLGMALPASSAEDLVAFYASTRVDVDATGKPVRVEAPADLPDPIRAFIEKRVASWQYTAAMRDGVPHAGTTYVNVGACAVPADGGYRLAVDFKGNGPRYADGKRMPPPAFPRERRSAAEFVVVLAIDGKGDTAVDSIERTDGSRLGNREFEASLRQWVQKLHFDPEVVGGEAVATRVRIPVSYFIAKESRGQILAERKSRALATDECRLASGEAAGLVPVALDSPIQVTPSG